MWYIVKTDYYKEQEAIRDLQQLEAVGEIYFPVYRPKEENDTEGKAKGIRFIPVINGILFVYAASADGLKNHLNGKGYFLKKKDVGTSSDGIRRQVEGNAHLFGSSMDTDTLDDVLRLSAVPDEDVYRYKVCIEQRASHTEQIQIIDRSFNELVADNDLVQIVDGPFSGFTGVIKQVKSHGVKDRHLFFRMGNWCVSLSGVRRFNYIILRETSKGHKAQLTNTWRNIDFLTGKLQTAGFPDTASAALRNILFHFNHSSTTGQCRQALLTSANQQPTEDERRAMEQLAAYVLQMDHEELSALHSLKQYFQSKDNSVAQSLEQLIPDMSLRPFLTPISELNPPNGEKFSLLAHRGFSELLFRVDLTDFLHQAGEHYDIHIALRQNRGEGVTAMVNWGEFAHRYICLTQEERTAFLADLRQKGYASTFALLTTQSITDITPYQSGFTVELPTIVLSDIWQQYTQFQSGDRIPYATLRGFLPLVQLIRICIPAAVEMWQRQRLLEWRHLVQRYVLLHRA